MTARGQGVCVGRSVSGAEIAVIRISDAPVREWDDSLRVLPGDVGEIVVKGPMVTREYLRRPEETSLAKIREGAQLWHRMGDLGRMDEKGRLWFYGRKAHRVRTLNGELYPIPIEGVFNTHPDVKRTALVAVAENPVLCVEREVSSGISDAALTKELLSIGARHSHTRAITTILYHPSFPVDIRHNAKISREALSRWAAKRLS
jgi:acyl-CoA synthetase (AMP-forming)/AMP-acid ligase II